VQQCGCLTCHQDSDPVIVRHHLQINLLLSRLTEPQRRWYVATLSQAPASPSIRDLVLITALSRSTIMQGRREGALGLADVPVDRQRRAGGGRPATENKIRTSKP
jgi:hypothetical protein